MSIELYKEGDDVERHGIPCNIYRVEPRQLQQAMKDGWRLDLEELYLAPTQEEADTNHSGKLSSNEVRAAAKDAGLPNWETARINTLKGELGYAQR